MRHCQTSPQNSVALKGRLEHIWKLARANRQLYTCIRKGLTDSHCEYSGAVGTIVSKHADVCTCRRTAILTGLCMLLISPGKARAKQKISQAGDWSSPGLSSPAVDVSPEFFKTSAGVKVQELVRGKGPAAQNGDRIELEYVLRRTNGYFIYSTQEGVSFQPKDIPTGPYELKLGDEAVIPGLQDAVRGMKAGGKRRALVPPDQGYTSSALQPQPPTFATQRQLLNHSNEPLLFELQLLAIRD